ncbi:MAG: four helix bundle protein [Syntrophobacterales bacterium]|nr:four helix bundle protein [Syntrophobacterales bacterium]
MFQITRGFPSEEKFSLVDQIQRSSRSVCANLAKDISSYVFTFRFSCITRRTGEDEKIGNWNNDKSLDKRQGCSVDNCAPDSQHYYCNYTPAQYRLKI